MKIAQRYEDFLTIWRLLDDMKIDRRYEDFFDDVKLKLPALKTWRPWRLKVSIVRSFLWAVISCFTDSCTSKLIFSKLVWCLYGYLYLSTFCSLSPQTLHWRSYYNGCWCQDKDKGWMQLNTEFKVNPLCRDLMKRKHKLAEGRTPEEVGVHKCTLYSSLRKPESINKH